MELVTAIALLGGFVLGVFTSKYAISEAEQIKKHVTDEVAEVRADLAALLAKVAAKV